LLTLQQADALFIPGSSDPRYTASKIYSYLLAQKPLLAIFNNGSNTVKVLNECTQNAAILTFEDDAAHLTNAVYQTLIKWAEGIFVPVSLSENFEAYSANNLTRKQTELFNEAIKYLEATNTND